MTQSFNAILVSRDEEKKQSVGVVELNEDQLMDGDVTVSVEATTVNYKDGLAITGKGPVVRHWPMVPGIDLAGTVTASSSSEFKEGDKVLLNGFGVGEGHWGAYAGKARVKSDWLIPLPSDLTAKQAMAVGTAGYTAMLTDESDFLKGLGANEIIDRAELSEAGRPLGKERWAGGVDAVGSHTLSNLLAQTNYGGAIAACGLAQGFDLPATVMPFILRGVALLGVDSVMASEALRVEAWGRIVNDLDLSKLDTLTTEIGFDDIIAIANDIVDGKIRGRVVVDMAG